MMLRCTVGLALALLLVAPALASAAGVWARFDLSSPSGGPFPSDMFTVPDPSQNTGLRVNLPKPATCPAVPPPPPALFGVPTDCFDIDELNTLDGFNLQPRLRVPFTGAIDPTSVAGNVFLISLGDALGGHGGARVEVNQVVWDPATNTLFAESDELLDQHTRYLLVVTDGVRDAAGRRLRAAQAFTNDDDRQHGDGGHQTHGHHPSQPDAALKAYRRALERALDRVHLRGHRVVAASLFTTQSATAVLEKIRNQTKRVRPRAATILGSFPRVPETTVVFNRQVRVSGDGSIVTTPLPLDLFDRDQQIGALVFGSYVSPDYETPAKYIPPVGTRTGKPIKQADARVFFNLFVPAGPKPASGWPVAIFGHGFTDSKQGAPFTVAGSLAAQGIATIAINVVGHGGGAGGSLVILPGGGEVPSGGRGIDQNGDGAIDSTEGVNAAFPRTIVGNRDGLRQTVVDLMQLVRVIETGGIRDLDPERIYYAGQSFGGIYGTKFLALEPGVRAGVLNVPGGPIADVARISPVFRGLVALALNARVPTSLLNGPFPVAPPLFGFNENIPLRHLPPVVNTVAGAVAIQEVIDNAEWASQAGNPVAYAPHLVKSPLAGMMPKSVIVQLAKGDRTVPNPTTNNILRAGDLVEYTSYFRNDVADAANSAFPNDPHTFLTRVIPAPLPGGVHPEVIAVARMAQALIAAFFASDGTMVIDPDGATGRLFEVPVSAPERPLLEQLNFLP